MIKKLFPKNLKQLSLVSEDLTTLEFDSDDGTKFENLEMLKIEESPKFIGFGNIDSVFPKLAKLRCSNTGLSCIDKIALIFPKLKDIRFWNEKYLSDITPLIEYGDELYGTAIDKNMEPVLKQMGIPVYEGFLGERKGVGINDTILLRQRNENMSQRVVIKKEDTQLNCLKAFVYSHAYDFNFNPDTVQITELDVKKANLSNVYVSLEVLHNLPQFPIIAKKIENMLIAIPNSFGNKREEDIKGNFVQIVNDIESLAKTEKGRSIQFEIKRIPNLSDKEYQVLLQRYGRTFLYEVPIKCDYGVLHTKNRNYKNRNLHVDEMYEIRKCLDSLLIGRNLDGTVYDKVATVDMIMQEFTLIQEIFTSSVPRFGE